MVLIQQHHMNKYLLAGSLGAVIIGGITYSASAVHVQKRALEDLERSASILEEEVPATQQASIDTQAPSTTAKIDAPDQQKSEPAVEVVPKELPAQPVKEQEVPVAVHTGLTLAEVSQHDSKTSCYTAINGSVYDLTSYISKHPGGARKILSLCGTDGTKEFMSQHEGDAKPEQILATLRIDSLAQ